MTNKTEQLPSRASLVSGVALNLATGGGDFAEPAAKKRDFEGLAYTGARFSFGPFGDQGVVELEGLEIPESGVAALQQHDFAMFAGKVTGFEKDGGELKVKGFLFSDEDGQRIANKSDEGAEWQMSIGFDIDLSSAVFLGEEASMKVNGQDEEGPLYVLQKTKLAEISFVPLGADPNTSALALERGGGVSHDLDTEEANVAEQSEKRPDAATLAQTFSSEFAEDPAFALSAIQRGLSLEQARAEFKSVQLKKQTEQLEHARAELEAAKREREELEAKLAKAEKPSAGVALSGGIAQPVTDGDPVRQWEDLVREETKRLSDLGSRGAPRAIAGLSRSANVRAQAAHNVALSHPELREEYLEAFNARVTG